MAALCDQLNVTEQQLVGLEAASDAAAALQQQLAAAEAERAALRQQLEAALSQTQQQAAPVVATSPAAAAVGGDDDGAGWFSGGDGDGDGWGGAAGFGSTGGDSSSGAAAAADPAMAGGGLQPPGEQLSPPASPFVRDERSQSGTPAASRAEMARAVRRGGGSGCVSICLLACMSVSVLWLHRGAVAIAWRSYTAQPPTSLHCPALNRYRTWQASLQQPTRHAWRQRAQSSSCGVSWRTGGCALRAAWLQLLSWLGTPKMPAAVRDAASRVCTATPATGNSR
jgi:hypothetical protein